MRDWKLLNPIKVIDQVKAMLLAERTGAEWEILEGNEWEDAEAEGKAAEEQRNGQTTRIEETGILVRPEENPASVKESGDAAEREDQRGKGTTGWTKLKSR